MDVSVIFATYNRQEILDEVFQAWREVDKVTKYTYEIICSDDESSDHTVEIIKRASGLPVKLIENKKGGAASARNAALAASSGKIIIFTGDDIFPEKNYINAHFENYLKYGEHVATLGRIAWHPKIRMNHLMYHITEIGCEQFGFIALPVYQFVDFRHFYTSNISVPAKLLYAQEQFFNTGFDKYGFEDIELGYRLQKAGMKIYYDPDIIAYHHHVYDSVEKFCERQTNAGEELVVFSHMHEDLEDKCICDVENCRSLFLKYKKNHPGNLSFQGKWIKRIVTNAKKWCLWIERRLHEQKKPFYEAVASIIYAAIFRFYYAYGTVLRIASETCGKTSEEQLMHFTYQYMKKPYQEIYWDLGRDFNENDARKWVYWDTSWNEVNQRVPDGTKRIRIAPLKDYCKADIPKIEMQLQTGEKVKANIKWHNAKKMVGSQFDFSNTNDPCILIEELPAGVIKLSIKMSVKSVRKRMRIYKLARNAAARMFHRVQCKVSNDRQWKIDYAYGQARKIQIGIISNFSHEKKEKLIAEYQEQIAVLGGNVIVSDADDMYPGYTDYLYHPCAEPLDITQFLQAAYTLMDCTADYLLISRAYTESPNLACGELSDVVIYSSILQKGRESIWEEQVSGKYMRLPGYETEERVMKIDAKAFCSVQPSEFRISYRDFGKRSDEKPLVFVIPVFLAVGGVERNTIEIMRQLKNRYDFCLITTEYHTQSLGSLHYQLKGICRYIFDLMEITQPQNHLKVLFELKEIFKPQVVWFCNNSPWFECHMAQVRKIFSDIPIVAQDVYDTKEGWITYYNNPEMRMMDRYIAITELIRETFIQKYQIPGQKVDVIYPVVDDSHIRLVKKQKLPYQALCKKYGLDVKKEHYAYIARLAEQKNPLRYLKLVKEIIKEYGEQMQFVMVGDGVLRDQIDAFIKEHQMDGQMVRIPYIENIPELLQILDGLMILSNFEGMPIVSIEAMSMGVPVFSTDSGDTKRFVEKNQSGMILDEKISDAENFIQFHRHLHEYKKHAQDHAQDILDFFSAKNIAEKYDHTFKKAVRDRVLKK